MFFLHDESSVTSSGGDTKEGSELEEQHQWTGVKTNNNNDGYKSLNHLTEMYSKIIKHQRERNRNRANTTLELGIGYESVKLTSLFSVGVLFLAYAAGLNFFGIGIVA